MVDISRLGRTTDGRLFWLPWRQSIVPEPVVTAHPTISGTVAPGQTVSAVAGVYAGTGIVHDRWTWTQYDAAGAINGYFEGPSYEIAAWSPSGKLVLEEIVHDAYQRRPSLPAKAEATLTAIVGLPVFTKAPTISATSYVVGSVLQAVNGTATGSPAPALAGQWLRDGAGIPGATGLGYTVTTADAGKVIAYANTATSGANVATAVSNEITIAAVGATAPVFNTKPTISRNATTGLFTAVNGVAAGTSAPVITGQWVASAVQGSGYAAIPGATALTWAPTALYAGQYVAFYNDADSSAGTKRSQSTSIQVPITEGFTAQPAVTPTTTWRPGTTISISNGTYGGVPTAFAYEWEVDGAVNTSLTASSFALSKTSAGRQIRGRVKITYASGNTYTSNYTSLVTVQPALTNDDVTTVSTLAELRTAVSSAAPGDIIEIEPGNYGSADLTNLSRNTARGDLDNRATYVWIRPQDRANPPKFTSTMQLAGSSGLWIDGLHFDGRGSPDTGANSNDDIVSDNYPNGARVASTGAKGIRIGGTAYRIMITNCLFQFHHRGIEFPSNNDGTMRRDISIVGNEFVENGMDIINAFRIFVNLRVLNNLVHKGHIDYKRTTEKDASGNETRHADQLIQFDLTYTNDYTDTVNISYNWGEVTQSSVGGAGHLVFQGVTNLLTSKKYMGDGYTHKNWTFQNNFCYAPDPNGFGCQSLDNAVIRSNWFKSNKLVGSRTGNNTPTVQLGSRPWYKDVTIVNNSVQTLRNNGELPIPSPNSNSTNWGSTGEVTVSGTVRGEDVAPTGWVTLTKTNSSLTSSSYRYNGGAPSGNVGRYRVGWSS